MFQSDSLMKNKPYFLALNRLYRVGPLTILKLLKYWPDLREMFELPEASLVRAGVPAALAHGIACFNWDWIEDDLLWECADKKQHILTWEDAAYPTLLKEIHDAPAVLYAKGCLSAFKQPMIAMVGTRRPSIMGEETARYFARQLSAQHITIVSGLAMGIDAQAHRGCLDVSGRTVAVMGTGIDKIYPWKHLRLADEICQNGLLLSEFPLKTTPNAGHFPRRNRIISGLSSITLIVEAAIKSGSLITARLACEQNRDVLAIPSSIHNPQARGCHYLLQQGAKLVTSVQDVLDELGIEGEVATSSPKKLMQDMTTVASSNKNLVKFIGYDVASIDQIILRSGLDVGSVTCGLADLELQGIIKAVTGGYMRCS